ncbi:MAG: AbrB/MazE/SpoVT family DNA-binding domain-containing protein [Oscillospiraceae bacterium]|nr:AbrB/MazE/SpoVT family DNA-binding domain-containing protein [Oscillospiraceae bacterium]
MEVAKVTSKGQITIPISIRKCLGINEGDKILFIYKHDGVMMVNPNSLQGGVPDGIVDIAETVVTTETVAVAKESKAPSVAATKATVRSDAPAVAEPTQSAIVNDAIASETPPVSTSILESASPPPVQEPSNVDTFNLNTLMDDQRSMGSL